MGRKMKKILKQRVTTGTFLLMAMLLFLLPCVDSQEAKVQAANEAKSTETEQTEAGSKSNALRKVRVGYLIYPEYQEGEGEAPKTEQTLLQQTFLPYKMRESE